MTEANLAITRKVILYTGLLVSALLFIYPQWRISVHTGAGRPAVNHELGRAFIASPPLPSAESSLFLLMGNGDPVRIHYVRQITEVAIALLFTFGLMHALKLRKPTEKHGAEE